MGRSGDKEKYQRSIISMKGTLIDKEDHDTIQEIVKKINVCSLTHTYLSRIKMLGDGRRVSKLDLSGFDRLKELPEEIANLNSLEWLNLEHLQVRFVPSSFCNLINLKVLDLYGANIESLPESIDRLTSLMYLDLCSTNIESLPESIDRLTSLMYLDLREIKTIPELVNENSSIQYLLKLAKKCRSLGHLRATQGDNDLNVCHQLACNRARYRIGFWTMDRRILLSTPRAWPIVINRATALQAGYQGVARSYISVNPCYISRFDTVYQLLMDEREAFIGIVLAQDHMDVQSRIKRGMESLR